LYSPKLQISFRGFYSLYTYDIPVPGPHIGSGKTPKKSFQGEKKIISRAMAGGIVKETRPMRPLRQEAQIRRQGHWEGGQVQARGWKQRKGARTQEQLQTPPDPMDPVRSHRPGRKQS